MDILPGMQVFHALEDLEDHLQDCFEGEIVVELGEEELQAGAEKVHDQEVVALFEIEVVDVWQAFVHGGQVVQQIAVELEFVLEFGVT